MNRTNVDIPDRSAKESRSRRDECGQGEKTDLSDPDDKQAIRLCSIINSQLPQHLCQPRIIRSSSNETHCENSIEGDLEILVVRVLG